MKSCAPSFIAAVNRCVGCAHPVTFDRKAGRRPGFVQRSNTAEPVCRTPCVRIMKASQKVK